MAIASEEMSDVRSSLRDVGQDLSSVHVMSLKNLCASATHAPVASATHAMTCESCALTQPSCSLCFAAAAMLAAWSLPLWLPALTCDGQVGWTMLQSRW